MTAFSGDGLNQRAMQAATVGPSHLLGFEALGPQLVALIWEGVEPVGEGSLPQEVGGLELSLKGGNPTLPPTPLPVLLIQGGSTQCQFLQPCLPQQ